MSTVRVYKSTDPGAPAHPSATRGSMAALLRACLVTGYGSGENFKAPAGWEEPFAATTNYAVFRAMEGARQFYQIFDNDNNFTSVRAFEAMSSVTTGEGQWLSDAGSNSLGKRHVNTDQYSTSWLVVADERTCYVFLSGRFGLSPAGFGEYQMFLDDYPYNSFVAGHSQTSLPSESLYCYAALGRLGPITNAIVPGVMLHRRLDGSFGGAANLVGYANNTYDWLGGPYNGFPLSEVPGLVYPIYPVTLGGGASNLRGHTGFLRGLYAPMATMPKNHLAEFDADGKRFLAVSVIQNNVGGASQYGQFFIDIAGGWD